MIQNSQVAALAARVQYSAEPRKQFVAPSAEASRYAAYGRLAHPGGGRGHQLPGRGARTHLRLAAPDRVGPRRRQHRRRRDRRAVPARGAEPAARRIVQLAAPFPPFPPEIARDTDVLVITRSWHFVNDTLETQAP